MLSDVKNFLDSWTHNSLEDYNEEVKLVNDWNWLDIAEKIETDEQENPLDLDETGRILKDVLKYWISKEELRRKIKRDRACDKWKKSWTRTSWKRSCIMTYSWVKISYQWY